MSDTKSIGQRRPPYVPYRTFKNFLLDHRRGLPDVLDSKFLKTIGGTLRQQLLATMRYLDLIDENNNVKTTLHQLVGLEDEKQKAALRDIIKNAYGFIFKDSGFDLTKAADSKLRRGSRARA